MSIVFVIDKDEKPLLPTNPARARRLLNSGKARVKQVVPFTIQLERKIDNPIGEFEVGVDDGAKYVGIAIKNSKTNDIVFHSQINHRQDVSRKVEQRSNYRSARRYRLRNRKPRFKNRIKSRIVPSIRQRKEVIIRVLKDMNKRLNIKNVIVEEVKFNHSRNKYGKYFSLVEIGKKFLKDEIKKLGYGYIRTYGYITKPNRIQLGLSKTHSHDACAIVKSNKILDREYQIKPRRTRVWENNPSKKCTEKNGFMHYDLIKARHRTKGYVIGSIRSLKKTVISVRTKYDDSFIVSYNKSRVLQKFNGLIYSY